MKQHIRSTEKYLTTSTNGHYTYVVNLNDHSVTKFSVDDYGRRVDYRHDSEDYLGTFLNDEKGRQSYQNLQRKVKQKIKGKIQFVKMGRKVGVTRDNRNGSTPLNNATHFDVYVRNFVF
jgi:hypothetical protein